MALANTSASFGSVTKTLHWLTALLILTAIPLGLMGTNGDISTEDGIARTAQIFSLHKTVGVMAFFVALIRILWAITQERPGLLHPERRLERFAAEAVHWLLYISMLLVPLSGWLHHAAATGFAPILWPFGQSLPFVPKSEAVAHFFEGWHFVLTKVLALSVVLHIAGALKHHVMDKDATLRRMLPGAAQAEAPLAHESGRGAFLSALAIYALALGAGSYLGMQGKTASPGAELAAVESEWAVEDGTLGISVKQMGSDVSGTFADWTAEISFDEARRTGSVRAVIAVGSLTLGSVTGQALGADYLDAAGFPEAVFVADLRPEGDGMIAEGSLSLRGAEVPVAMPFDLEIVDGTASVSGQAVLNRIDFGVGAAAQPGEGSLGFEVLVTLDLTARGP